MKRNGLPFESEGIFLTNVISHICMVPTLRQLAQRRWSFEAGVTGFTLFASFMYHLTQALQTRIFYEELDWHKIDNFGAISSFGIWLTYLAAFRDPLLDQYVKYGTIFTAVFSQVAYPWELAYTIVPILMFMMMPVCTFVLRYFNANGQPLARIRAAGSVYEAREAGMGLGLLLLALICFHFGLDEKNDPYRMFHGGWHAFGGFSSLHLWRMVKHPTAERSIPAAATEKDGGGHHHHSRSGSLLAPPLAGGSSPLADEDVPVFPSSKDDV